MKNKRLLALSSLVVAFAVLTPLTAAADGKAGGSLTCTTQNNQVWDIEGGYTDATIAPQVSLYQGSTYVQRYNTAANNVQVSTQVSAQTSNLTYTLYNSADSSGAVLTTASCTAKTVAAAPVTASTPTATSTPAPTTVPTATAATPTVTDTTATPDTKTAATTSTKKTATAKPVTLADSTNRGAGTAARNVALLTVGPLVILIMIVSVWIVFRKAGRPGWGSIIPIYNSWLVFEMAGKPGWWALLLLVPLVNVVMLALFALAAIEIAKRFGKSPAFGIFGLFLFSFIGWPYLAFSHAQYTEPKADAVVNADTPFSPVAS